MYLNEIFGLEGAVSVVTGGGRGIGQVLAQALAHAGSDVAILSRGPAEATVALVEAAGFGVKSEIVWDKGTPGMGVGWRSQHELILFGAKAATHFDGHKGYGNVLSISRSGNELHPTQKPVELLEKLVDNTDFATGVYDPFGGSGTTLAACEAYGQPSYIMELTPAFTDVIVKRYIRITGKTTVRCVRQGRELPREEIAAIFEPDEEGGEQE